MHDKASMHGVTRDEVAAAKVRVADKGVKVQAKFKISMIADEVSVPAVVRFKVNDEIELNVMLRVKPKK